MKRRSTVTRIRPRATFMAMAGVVGIVAVVAALWWMRTPGSNESQVFRDADSTDAAMLKALGNLELSFEANRGQTDERVAFLARGHGYSVYLTEEASAVVSLPGQAVLNLNLPGARREPRIAGVNRLEAESHYLIGNDRENWQTHIPHYARVHYSGIYAGIDLVFYGNEGQLEYDFVVSPGADPGVIRLAVEGADDLTLDEAGNLVLSLAAGGGDGVSEAGGGGEEPEAGGGGEGPEIGGGGEDPEAGGGDEASENGHGAPAHLTLQAPVIYQTVEGERQPIAGSYVLLDESEVGFRIGDYDAHRELVIDPVLTFSTYLGGETTDNAFDIAVDVEGYAYITGDTRSIFFPMEPATGERVRPSEDVYVLKIDVASSTLVYTAFLGASEDETGYGIAVNSAGNAHVIGATDSSSFPVVNPVQPTSMGSTEVFVVKLTRDGSSIVYSTFLGGADIDQGHDIVLDAQGNAYLTGDTQSTDFPTIDSYQPSRRGTFDAFVAKLSPAGDTLTYSTYLGGSNYDGGAGIDIDAAGNAYVTGETASTDFPTEFPYQVLLIPPDWHAFVTKLNAAGSTLAYSTYLGGTERDSGNDIAVDSAGNAYVIGNTSSSDFPTTSEAFQTTSAGSGDAFVTKLHALGAPPVYSTYMGGSLLDRGEAIALDRQGNAYVTGSAESSDFPTLRPFQPMFGGGIYDAFVAALTSRGSGIYSSFLGGEQYDGGWGIEVAGEGDVYVTGSTESMDFPTVRPIQGSINGTLAVFVARVVTPLDFWVAWVDLQDTLPAVAVPPLEKAPPLPR